MNENLKEMPDLTIRLGAAAGDGIQSGGEMISKVLSRSGLFISTYNGNQSVIRGGLVWFHIHAARWRVSSLGFGEDFLIPLTQLCYDEHYSELNQGGAVIFDPAAVKAHDLPPSVKAVEVPLGEIALRYDKKPIMRNTVAAGALTAVTGIEFAVLSESISDQFGKKNLEIAQSNVRAAKDGFDLAAGKYGIVKKLEYDYKTRRPLMHADFTVALGAAAAGCRFYAAYPMSPASPIVHWMAANAKKLGMTVFLGEDEISVVNSTIGASYAGARAMCATSGGGFSLMQEAVGEAAMTETPLVVVDVMRAGPSTGLPTKTSQGDLNMMLGISHDDFPRVIISPRTPQEAFYVAGRSFNLSEWFQVPVLILLDFAIADGGYQSLDDLDFGLPLDRGKIASVADPSQSNGTWFKRFALTPDNISARAFPGTRDMEFVAKTDEHDEFGHDLSDLRSGLKEAIRLRERMQEKRMKKLEQIAKEMDPPELFGPDRADLTILSWGSTANPVREALRRLAGEGLRVNSLEFTYLYPLNVDVVTRTLKSCASILDIEDNYSAQFAGLLKRETGVDVTKRFLKYNGEPIYPSEVVEAARRALEREVQALV
jgi:2-oxoglutarate ferredoxin oxidoreductase subunit alpha